MSSDDTLPAYLWTLQIASIVPKALIVLTKAVLNEVPERTKIGKSLLAVEVSIILAGLTALSPVLAILLAELLVLSVLFFAGRVVFQILDWCDHCEELLRKKYRLEKGHSTDGQHKSLSEFS